MGRGKHHIYQCNLDWKSRMALVLKVSVHRFEKHHGRATFLDIVRKTWTDFSIKFFHYFPYYSEWIIVYIFIIINKYLKSVVISIFCIKVFILALANELRAGDQDSEDGCEIQYQLIVFSHPLHKIMRMLTGGFRSHKWIGKVCSWIK